MRVLTVCVLLLLGLGLMAQAKDPERPRCDNCGMYADMSSARVLATINVSKKDVDLNFCGLGCLDKYLSKNAKNKAQLVGFTIMDYGTFGSKSPQMIDGAAAQYLYGAEYLPGTMKPYIAAFSDEDAATAAKQDLGGELMSFEDMWAALQAAGKKAAEAKASGSDEDQYVCSCEGGCCDDISSDKPGTCPNCGMKLIKKSDKK